MAAESEAWDANIEEMKPEGMPIEEESLNGQTTENGTTEPADESMATTSEGSAKKQHPSGKTVIVKNIPSSAFFTMNDDLKARFAQYGNITYIKRGGITVDFDTVHPTLSAYVNFDNTESAEKALAENGTIYEGQPLEVEVLKGGPFAVSVSNLPYTISKSCLQELFAPCGAIKDIVKIPARPTAFVDFEDEEGMKKALSLSGSLVINNVEVVLVKKDEQRPNVKQKKVVKQDFRAKGGMGGGVVKKNIGFKRMGGGGGPSGGGGGNMGGPWNNGGGGQPQRNRAPMMGGFYGNVWDHAPFRGGGGGPPRQGNYGGPAQFGNNNWGPGGFRDGGNNMESGFKRRKQNDWLWQY